MDNLRGLLLKFPKIYGVVCAGSEKPAGIVEKLDLENLWKEMPELMVACTNFFRSCKVQLKCIRKDIRIRQWSNLHASSLVRNLHLHSRLPKDPDDPGPVPDGKQPLDGVKSHGYGLVWETMPDGVLNDKLPGMSVFDDIGLELRGTSWGWRRTAPGRSWRRSIHALTDVVLYTGWNARDDTKKSNVEPKSLTITPLMLTSFFILMLDIMYHLRHMTICAEVRVRQKQAGIPPPPAAAHSLSHLGSVCCMCIAGWFLSQSRSSTTGSGSLYRRSQGLLLLPLLQVDDDDALCVPPDTLSGEERVPPSGSTSSSPSTSVKASTVAFGRRL